MDNIQVTETVVSIHHDIKFNKNEDCSELILATCPLWFDSLLSKLSFTDFSEAIGFGLESSGGVNIGLSPFNPGLFTIYPVYGSMDFENYLICDNYSIMKDSHCAKNFSCFNYLPHS